MIDKIRNRMESDEGFTLIELLVVILIIGILAAIAIPSFLNQRYKGQDACAKSMAKQMQTAIETYNTDYNSYTGVNVATLKGIESSIVTTSADGCVATAVGAGNSAAGTCAGAATDSGYCVSATSATGNLFVISNQSGTVGRTCNVGSSNPNAGGCKGATNTANSKGTW